MLIAPGVQFFESNNLSLTFFNKSNVRVQCPMDIFYFLKKKSSWNSGFSRWVFSKKKNIYMGITLAECPTNWILDKPRRRF